MCDAARSQAAPTEDSKPLASFVTVYNDNVGFVWRNLRRLGVPEHALDDALQDVFLVVHRRLDEFEGRASMQTWLFAIVRRIAATHRRKVERAATVQEVDPEHMDGCTTTPFESAARTEAVDRLCRVLAGLDESKREVFILAELEELPGPEVASSLDINLNTMYARLRAARADFNREVARLQALDRGRSR